MNLCFRTFRSKRLFYGDTCAFFLLNLLRIIKSIEVEIVNKKNKEHSYILPKTYVLEFHGDELEFKKNEFIDP